VVGEDTWCPWLRHLGEERVMSAMSGLALWLCCSDTPSVVLCCAEAEDKLYCRLCEALEKRSMVCANSIVSGELKTSCHAPPISGRSDPLSDAPQTPIRSSRIDVVSPPSRLRGASLYLLQTVMHPGRGDRCWKTTHRLSVSLLQCLHTAVAQGSRPNVSPPPENLVAAVVVVLPLHATPDLSCSWTIRDAHGPTCKQRA
jgi:hypothetical protein